MDDDALITVLAVTGTGTGAVIGKAIPALSPEMVIIVAVVFGVIGTISGYYIVAVRKAKRRRSPTLTPRLESARKPTSTAFRKRLADFTGRDESEVMVDSQPYKSKMPFWSAVDALVRVPPKTARLIRVYLISIRNAVRGRPS